MTEHLTLPEGPRNVPDGKEPTGRRWLGKLLTGAFLQIGAYAVGIAVGLFLTPYLYRTLGDREYAIFLMAGLFTNWCGLIDFGMTTTVSRFVTVHHAHRDAKALNETANTAFALLAFLAILALGVGGVSALTAKIGWSANPDIATVCAVFLITSATFALAKVGDGASGLVNGALRQELTGLDAVAMRLATGIVSFLALYFGGRVIALVTGSFVLTALNLAVLFTLAKIAVPAFVFSPSLFRKKRAKELLGYSVWTFAQQVGDLLIQRSDLILIAALMTLTDMAHYQLAVVALVSYYGSFAQAMTLWQTNWFAHLAERGEDALLESSRVFSYRAMTYLTVFMSFVLIFWGRAFLIRWVGPECLDAYPALVLTVGAFAFYRGVAEINIRLLQGTARHQLLAKLTMAQGVMSVALSVLFVRLGWGLFGVGLGTAIPAFAVHGLILPLDVCRIRGDSPLRHFGRQARTLLLASAALIPPYFLIRRFLTPDYPTLLWVAVLSGVLYCLTILAIGFPPQERRAILSFLKKRPESGT